MPSLASTFTTLEIVVLTTVALLGHAMALFWYLADRWSARICGKTIYDLPIPAGQLRRELVNSLHTPLHAVMLALALYLGFFDNTTWTSLVLAFVLTTAWAEVWHYFSHRMFHLKKLHWIHREHHRSRLNSPFTAISFAFSEKLIFNLGMIGVLAAVDTLVPLSFLGVGAWYIVYLAINSFSHANFEIKSERYLEHAGKFLASTTYHSLHHSRYIKNFGLGTRFLDRLLGTEWEDYEALYEQVVAERRPLEKLGERVLSRASSPTCRTSEASTSSSTPL